MGFNPDKIADYVSDVDRITRALIADGVNVSGSDGAFEITKRVAFGNGLFLVRKTQGNNSHGYQIDVVAAADGTIADILRDAGGENGAQFNIQPRRVNVTDLAPALNDWDAPDTSEPHKTDDELAMSIVESLTLLSTRISLLIAKIDELLTAGIRLHQ